MHTSRRLSKKLPKIVLYRHARIDNFFIPGPGGVRRRRMAQTRMDKHIQGQPVPFLPGGTGARLVRQKRPVLLPFKQRALASLGKSLIPHGALSHHSPNVATGQGNK